MSSTHSVVAAAQPSVVQIILPPGITLQQYYAFQGTTVSVAIAMAVAVALAIWDFLTLLPDELALYRNAEKRLWTIPGTWAFVILRYSGVLALMPGLWFTSLQNQHCQVAASLGEVGVVLVTASAGSIFCFRVFSLWHGNKFVYGVVGTLYLFMVGCWLATATQLRASQGQHTPFGSNCILHPVPAWAPLAFASSVAFDTVVLALTIVKIKGTRLSGVGGQILRDNLLYFALVSITNIVVLAIQSLGSNYETLKPVSLPYPTLMTTAMGSRVFLNLRLYNARRQADSLDIPLSGDIYRNQSGAHGRHAQGNPPFPRMKGVMVLESTYTHTDSKDHTLP